MDIVAGISDVHWPTRLSHYWMVSFCKHGHFQLTSDCFIKSSLSNPSPWLHHFCMLSWCSFDLCLIVDLFCQLDLEFILKRWSYSVYFINIIISRYIGTSYRQFHNHENIGQATFIKRLVTFFEQPVPMTGRNFWWFDALPLTQ